MSNILPQEIAGPPIWDLIHRTALQSPTMTLEELKSFLLLVLRFFPCPHCRYHGTEIITNDNGSLFRAGQDAFTVTVAFHNRVNATLSKPLMALEKAQSLYKLRKADTMATAIHVLLYSLNANQAEMALGETSTMHNRLRERSSSLSLLANHWSKYWPIASERLYFTDWHVPESDFTAQQKYMFQVFRTVPSLSSGMSNDLQTVFLAKAQQFLASGATTTTASPNISLTLLFYIIVFICILLFSYFAILYLQTRSRRSKSELKARCCT